MMANSSLRDVASSSGVSETTVSRVLNGVAEKYRIGKNTQQRVLEKARALGYRPNQTARALRLNRTFTIGLIIPDISNPFFARIAQSIEEEARAQGYFIILSVSQENTRQEISAIHQLISRQIDALIISPVGKSADHLQAGLRAIPTVVIDRYFPGQTQPYVVSDNFQGGYLAAEHLIQSGHRKIACIQGLSNTSPTEERLNGFLKAHERLGVPFNPALLKGDSFGMQNGYDCMKDLLSLPESDRPTALFAMSNLISLGVMEALAEAKKFIPDDLSLVAFDDHPYSRFLSAPITTIGQDYNAIGKQAVKLALQQINEETGVGSIVLPVSLNKRKSVKQL